MDFFEFIKNNNLKISWINESNLRAYVRKSIRYYNNKLCPFLDIATVDVDERYRGHGVFKAFLKKVEAEACKQSRGVYIENVLEPRLVEFLLKSGYSFFPNTAPECPSLFKFFNS